MTHVRSVLGLILLGILTPHPSLSAQVEIGMDATLTFEQAASKEIVIGDQVFVREDADLTTISIPNARLRLGFFTSPTVSVEIDTGFRRVSNDDGSVTTWELGGAPLFHFSHIDSGEAVGYVGPKIGFEVRNAADTDVAVRLGAKGGVKLPAGDSFLIRLEGFYEREFETDFFEHANIFGIAIGLSFLTK